MDNQTHTYFPLELCKLGLKNQQLIKACLQLGFVQTAKHLQHIDTQLSTLFTKTLGKSTHYKWRTQDDSKVRPSHAANDDKIFAWDNPPPTGHPGEEINCRCWAKPVGGDEYARQTLISAINDNPEQWTNVDFVLYYFGRSGLAVTLPQTGWLRAIMNFYANYAVTRDGTIGAYQAVERQILAKAKEVGSGGFTYKFDGHYRFQDGVLFSFGDSVVKGFFIGDAREEEGFLVITGFITYDFSDVMGDIFSTVEWLMEIENISREEATRRVGRSQDILGVPYAIEGQWKTKFNGAVRIEK